MGHDCFWLAPFRNKGLICIWPWPSISQFGWRFSFTIRFFWYLISNRVRRVELSCHHHSIWLWCDVSASCLQVWTATQPTGARTFWRRSCRTRLLAGHRTHCSTSRRAWWSSSLRTRSTKRTRLFSREMSRQSTKSGKVVRQYLKYVCKMFY